ncbi:MAG: DNA mismatch repair endonuclease MutL [Halanaerobiales bacterium]|nr:DNA mismatch repair endonuclease MutL [Halanaerobiales bacterium]
MASKIIVLSERVANQIAAGEVVERPASVVKELIENSIDAGSKRIKVEIIDGGRTSIRVLDNGEGISKEDILTAFERHATSKIRESSDIFSIRTLGFRGEALPSIASVSKVTIQSRTADESVGTLLRIEGGEVKDQREIGMAVGTDFLVENLFFNTPARYKYLKSITTELGQISDLFNRVSLANPQIGMSLSHNKKLVNRTPGTGRFLDTVLSVYGRDLVDNLIEVDYEECYIKVWGYVTRPTVYRSSRKHQSFYVNGRYVKSVLLSRGVGEAYNNLLPDKRHPIGFLFIKINPIHVDVNVHPAKFEVKFSRPEMVMEVVTKGIRQALLNADYDLPKPRLINNKNQQQEKAELTSLFKENEHIDTDISFDTGTDAGMDASTITDANTDANAGINYHITEDVESSANRVAERLAKLDYNPKNWDPKYRVQEKERGPKQAYYGKNISVKERDSYKSVSKVPSKIEEIDEEMVSDSGKSVSSTKGPGAFIAQLLPIGQIHKTYIIAESKDGFYVFDQHVVHERILYEELMDRFREKGISSQTLLIPLTLELTLKEIQVILENQELFNQMGFEVEHFGGNTIIINAVPRRLDERPDKDLFLEIVDMVLEEKKAGDRGRLYKKLITIMACKGAIKAGEYLEQGEMIRLLQELSKTENPRFCPHGRPIFFQVSEKELLKAFQRI